MTPIGSFILRIIRLGLLCATLFVTPAAFPQSVFPSQGPEFLYQTASDLRARMTVMTVSMQPGSEDFATMAYIRYGLGAKIVSIYVTNGESEESDSSGTLPHEQAAMLREEAYNAVTKLSGETYFLNLPDIAAASDKRVITNLWPPDTLRVRIKQAITMFRPDAILLFPDRSSFSKSLKQQALEQEFVSILKSMTAPSTRLGQWRVTKLFGPDQGKQAKPFKVSGIDSIRKKSFLEIGADARLFYRSKRFSGWTAERSAGSKYRILYPESRQISEKPESGLPLQVGKLLAPFEKRIRQISFSIQSGITGSAKTGLDTANVLKDVSSLLENIDDSIGKLYAHSYSDQVALLRWKLELESIRTALLGIRIFPRLSDNVVAERQVIFLAIDTIIGLVPGGSIQVHFPIVSQGWVVNESMERRFPLKYRESYSMLSPEKLAYYLPQTGHGLQRQRFAEQLNVIVVHQHPDKNKSFQVRLALPVIYCPRFTVESVTPMVRVVPGDRLIVRLTNHSRDGVADRMYVSDTAVVSNERRFRLGGKGPSFLDTLTLTWQKELKEGSYLIPIRIGKQIAGQFAARKFEVDVDTSKTVGLITGIVRSQTAEALRRLGVRFEVMDAQSLSAGRIAGFHSLIVDRRAMTLAPHIKEFLPMLRQFAANGGHLVILAQESKEWNRMPLLEGVGLENSTLLDQNTAVETDTNHSLLKYPNKISEEDWNEWIFRRSYSHVTRDAKSSEVEMPVRVSKNKWPVLLTSRTSKGRISYVDLDLQHQWMNLHSGSYKLLANLLSQ